MSEPSRWGPPGFDAASGPTVPLPTATRPAVPRPPGPRPPGPRPTAALPAQPRPTAQYPTPQAPPFPAPADHGDPYDDAYPDPYPAARPDEDRGRERRAPARSRTRGQVFAGVVLVLALMVSVLLGALTYQTLVSVDLISADPFASVAGWMSVLGGAALGALGVFLLALIALVVSRPKVLAGIGLFASVLLPVAAVVVGVWYGGDVLRQNVQSDIEAESAEAARAFAEELERNLPDIGPLRDLIVRIVEQGG